MSSMCVCVCHSRSRKLSKFQIERFLFFSFSTSLLTAVLWRSLLYNRKRVRLWRILLFFFGPNFTRKLAQISADFKAKEYKSRWNARDKPRVFFEFIFVLQSACTDLSLISFHLPPPPPHRPHPTDLGYTFLGECHRAKNSKPCPVEWWKMRKCLLVHFLLKSLQFSYTQNCTRSEFICIPRTHTTWPSLVLKSFTWMEI